MTLLLNPLLEGLEAARLAGGDGIHRHDEVTVDDRGDHWVFEFIPQEDALGGGVLVSISKADFQVLKVVHGQ